MFRVVIIDDEPMICRGMAEKINWSKWNCEVVGTGTNGLEGQQLIARVRPQIVISDIKMPGMTGLELARYINTEFSNIITILLTGYNEFEYARTALKENVFDYLTKPIDLNELQNTMERATAQLLLEQKQASEQEDMKLQLSEYGVLAETGFILDLMLNRQIKADLIDNKIRGLNLFIKTGRVILFGMEHVEDALFHEPSFHKLVNDKFDMYKCEVLPVVVEGRFAVIVKYNMDISRNVNEYRIMEATQDTIINIKSIYERKVFAGVGEYFQALDHLNISYKSAVENLKYRMFWDLDQYNEIEKQTSFVQTIPQDRISELYAMIEKGCKDNALQLLQQIFDSIKKARNSDLTRSIALEIIFHLTKEVRIDDGEAKESPIKEIMESSNFTEIMKHLSNNIQFTCDFINENKLLGRENIVNQILNYLHKNFQHPELSLQQVAGQFHLSESHLSRLFKKERGINFNDYLTQLRLDKAKNLLLEKHWLSNHEIASEVGFNDGKYMGLVFKKYIGMTLMEYKGRRSKKS